MGGMTGGFGIGQGGGFSPLSFMGGYGLGSISGLMGGMMMGGGGMLGGMGGGMGMMLPMMMMGGLSMLPMMMMMGGMFGQGQQAAGSGYPGGYGGGYGGYPGGYGGGIPGGYGYGCAEGYGGYGGGIPGGYGGYPPVAQCPVGWGGPPQNSGNCCCDPQQGGGCGCGGNEFPSPESGNLNNNPQNKTVSYTDGNGYKITTNYSNGTYPQVQIFNPQGKLLTTESGDPHESLGSGVKDLNGGVESDWTKSGRQLILPDGTVVSMSADGNIPSPGHTGGITGVNIYDQNGGEAVQESGFNTGNPTINETNNPYAIAQGENNINWNNAAAIGQNCNGQYTFEQLQSRDVPVGPAPAPGQPQPQPQPQPQQNKPGAPIWSWLLCPPAALGYDVVEHAGVGSGIDNFFGNVGSGISSGASWLWNHSLGATF